MRFRREVLGLVRSTGGVIRIPIELCLWGCQPDGVHRQEWGGECMLVSVGVRLCLTIRTPHTRVCVLAAMGVQATKDVVQSFISTFDFNPDLPLDQRTRVAAVGYAGKTTDGNAIFTETRFDLGEFQTPEAIKCAVGNMYREKCCATNTGDALRFVKDEMLTVKAGMRPDSKGIRRVVILITDGQSVEQAWALSSSPPASPSRVPLWRYLGARRRVAGRRPPRKPRKPASGMRGMLRDYPRQHTD